MSRKHLSQSEDLRSDVLIMIGSAVLISQTAEYLLRICLTFVFQKDPPLTLEKLQSQKATEKKSTLGYFVRQLQGRAEPEDHFDEMLEEFLDKRNNLIHSVDQIPGWDLYDEAGLDVAKNFVGRLALLSWEVTKTLCGAIRIWQKDNSLEVKFPDAADELFGEIDSVYVPLARSVFGFDSENITNDA